MMHISPPRSMCHSFLRILWVRSAVALTASIGVHFQIFFWPIVQSPSTRKSRETRGVVGLSVN